jgi:hypothetical protein
MREQTSLVQGAPKPDPLDPDFYFRPVCPKWGNSDAEDFVGSEAAVGKFEGLRTIRPPCPHIDGTYGQNEHGCSILAYP